MKIRRFSSGDEVTIAQIHNQAFSDCIDHLGPKYEYFHVTPSEVGMWLSSETDGLSSIWLAGIDDETVGYVQYFLHEEHCDLDIPVLRIASTHSDMGQSKLGVLLEYRRRGIATEILKHAEAFARTNNAEFLIATVFSDNVPAERLLERLGFMHRDLYYYPPFSETKPFIQDAVFAHFNLSNPIPHLHHNEAVEIRRADAGDVDGLQTLSRQSVTWIDPEFFTKKWIRDYILGVFRHTVFVAVLDGQIVGAMDFIEDRCRLGIAGTLPEYRRRGIGYTLFHGLLTEMKSRGIDEAIADTGMENAEAIHMYQRFGFVIKRKHHSWFKQLI